MALRRGRLALSSRLNPHPGRRASCWCPGLKSTTGVTLGLRSLGLPPALMGLPTESRLALHSCAQLGWSNLQLRYGASLSSPCSSFRAHLLPLNFQLPSRSTLGPFMLPGSPGTLVATLLAPAYQIPAHTAAFPFCSGCHLLMPGICKVVLIQHLERMPEISALSFYPLPLTSLHPPFPPPSPLPSRWMLRGQPQGEERDWCCPSSSSSPPLPPSTAPAGGRWLLSLRVCLLPSLAFPPALLPSLRKRLTCNCMRAAGTVIIGE